MKTYHLSFHVGLKEGVLDPAGQATLQVMHQMGFQASEVRIGKWIQVRIEAEDEVKALTVAEEMGHRLLANPVMETFDVTVTPA